MKRLKTILNSNYFYILLTIIAIIYCIIGNYLSKESALNENSTTFESIVIDYKLTPNKLSLTLKDKELIIANYSIQTKEEYDYLKEEIKYGIKIYTKGKLTKPSNNTIPYNFNYKNYLNNKGIHYILNINKYQIIKNKLNIIDKYKNIIYKYIYTNDQTGYLKAFVLGDKTEIDNYEDYQNIGVSHLFVLSGMHVIFLSKIIYTLIKNKYKKIVFIILLFIYTLILSFPISLTRCLIYMTIDSILKKYKIEISNIKTLFITAFIIILINYRSIYQISFYYSFTILTGIFISKEYLNSNNYIICNLKLSLITFLFSVPLSLYFFYQTNYLSIFYNLIYIPFISFIVYPLTLLSIVPYVSQLLIKIINIINPITSFLSHMPYLKINIGLNIIELLLFYTILITIILKKKYKLLFIPLLLPFFIIIKTNLTSSTSIVFFDVSQGDSSLIVTPYHKETILIDTGGLSNYSTSKNIINYLHREGITKISYLIITHGDFDHMGEAINLVNNFKVERVIFNCGPYNDLEQELIKVLDKKKIPYYSCIKELDIDNNKLYFLQTKEYDNENDNSNVIYTELDGYKFMFMGDASVTTEKEILDKYNLPDIDVLKVGHHGSKTSSGKEFIDEINPKNSIISVGKKNRYGHPNKEVLENLKDSKIYRTDIDGSIMFKIKNNKLKIETCSP